MHWNITKPWGVIASSLVVFTHLNADVKEAQLRHLDRRITALEQRKGTASGMINPPARPQIRNGADLFVFGEFLYWKANEDGIPLAVVNKGSANHLAHAKIENLRGKWDPAFRVGVGYDVPHDGWDVGLTWLRYNSHGHRRSIHSGSNRFVFPYFAPSADPIADNATCAKAKGRWRLLLNQLDLDLGREFFVSKWLTLRPHVGLRTDWISQKTTAKYENFSFLPPPNEVETKYRDRWWGLGLEGGLDTQWGLGEGWSIFGNLAAAIVYGKDRMRMKDENEPPFIDLSNGADSTPNGTFVKLRRKTWVARPILDLQLGVRWDKMFSQDHLHLGIQLGWENHIYFSQNQFPIFSDDFNLGKFFANQGDLSLQGWTLGVRLDF
jgi:hypothetical protein